MKRALLVINGEIPSPEIIETLRAQVQLVICTDGSAARYCEHQPPPDIVIGDLDSLTEKDKQTLSKQSTILERPAQDATDFEKALDYLIAEGFLEVLLIGIKGRRFDHAYTNMSIISKYAERLSLKLFDEDGFGTVLNKKDQTVAFEAPQDTTVSLLPLPRAAGIVTKGLHFPLNNELLELGVREGQSNFVSNEGFQVSLKEGALLVFILRDNWWKK